MEGKGGDVIQFLRQGLEMSSFKVRPMILEDVPQADEIEREAFPTQWPPTSYRRELNNKLAHYLVAYEEGKEISITTEDNLLHKLRFLIRKEKPYPTSTHQYIVGIVGFWVLYDEAHIITIAVREAYRRRGIGELLLISAIEEATRLNAQIMTLEVRVSNYPAQALYEKYGFKKTGIRRGYYTDNWEDGYIMSTERLTSSPFQVHFQHLKQLHSQKWGYS
jgi:ribosomal-protein-alanine N-acetyltransferase